MNRLLVICSLFLSYYAKAGNSLTGRQINIHSRDTTSLGISIDSLNIGKTYIVQVESNGCFHHSDLLLRINRQKQGYFASFQMKGKIEGKGIKKEYPAKLLTAEQIDSVRNFEIRLRNLAQVNKNCTTVDKYLLSVNSQSATYVIDDCDWQGIGRLVGYLFRKQ